LHQGAATGNLGLVKFALDQGQSVNSVLNGVLPIHVACCSGSAQVVEMLLDHGANVNARRYPRKYSGDRVVAPANVYAHGSTALHFAAANG
ncbi:ankyrin repeat-containing domain protein, partial [Thamnocephalis sphaerospora]